MVHRQTGGRVFAQVESDQTWKWIFCFHNFEWQPEVNCISLGLVPFQRMYLHAPGFQSRKIRSVGVSNPISLLFVCVFVFLPSFVCWLPEKNLEMAFSHLCDHVSSRIEQDVQKPTCAIVERLISGGTGCLQSWVIFSWSRPGTWWGSCSVSLRVNAVWKTLTTRCFKKSCWVDISTWWSWRYVEIFFAVPALKSVAIKISSPRRCSVLEHQVKSLLFSGEAGSLAGLFEDRSWHCSSKTGNRFSVRLLWVLKVNVVFRWQTLNVSCVLLVVDLRQSCCRQTSCHF